jgi:hypothetical protein
MEKKFKYESEALGVIHEEALESFRIGAISKASMTRCVLSSRPPRPFLVLQRKNPSPPLRVPAHPYTRGANNGRP